MGCIVVVHVNCLYAGQDQEIRVPHPKLLDLFHHHFPWMATFALFKRYNTQHDEVTGCSSSRINVEYNEDDNWFDVSSAALGFILMYPILYNTNSPAASLSSLYISPKLLLPKQTCLLCEHGWIPIINIIQSGSCWRRSRFSVLTVAVM